VLFDHLRFERAASITGSIQFERAGMGLYGLGIIAVSSVGFAGKSVLG
jgi:hypothetical protein